MNEALHMKLMRMPTEVAASLCEVHTWSLERLFKELMDLMRARHGKGGVNVCTPCIERMKAEADRRRGGASS